MTILNKEKKMRKQHYLIILLTSVLLLTACAKDTLKAPCPDFGAHCRKTPVNVWDYNT